MKGLILILCLLLSGSGAFAQTGARLAFEAASVKPSLADARNTLIVMPPGGRLEIGNMTLKGMIENAYRILPSQISGGPGWLDSVHFDISAKAGMEVKRDDVLLMLQSLLADRFRLEIRREVRELPVYALVASRKDGKPGPRLVASKKGSCKEADPVHPLAADPMTLCGNFMVGPDVLALVSAPISTAVPLLGRVVGRTVIDKTGFTGNFDVNVEWAPDENLAMRPPEGVDPPGAGGPSIFTVFRDRLGLAFRAEKAPVEVFVIERADKPSLN